MHDQMPVLFDKIVIGWLGAWLAFSEFGGTVRRKRPHMVGIRIAEPSAGERRPGFRHGGAGGVSGAESLSSGEADDANPPGDRSTGGSGCPSFSPLYALCG